MKHYLADKKAFSKVAIAALLIIVVAISGGLSAYILLPHRKDCCFSLFHTNVFTFKNITFLGDFSEA